MVAILSTLALLLASPCLVLVGIWIYHLRTATKLCTALGTMGASAASNGFLTELGRCDQCLFRTADGVTLRGTYVYHRAARRRGVLVFCHQFGSDRHVAARYVSRLLDEGFDLFAFDFRNHGMSEPMAGYTARAWPTEFEVLDVLAALDWVAARDDADPRGVALMRSGQGMKVLIENQ